MQIIRRILLTEYIGAILTACRDAINAFIGAIAQQVAYHSYMHRYRPMTELLIAERWNTTLTTAVKIVLYLTSAYLLARWLYGAAVSNRTTLTNGPQLSDE